MRELVEASRKSSENPGPRLKTIQPIWDVITGLKAQIEAVSESGMTIMHRYLEQEIRERSGP